MPISSKPVKFFFEDNNTLDKILCDFQDCIDKFIDEGIISGLKYDDFVNVKEIPKWEI
jgi:hypothetical protein